MEYKQQVVADKMSEVMEKFDNIQDFLYDVDGLPLDEVV